MKKINILVNLSTLKKGGGQNVALNFLESLFRITDNSNLSNYYFTCVKNTEIHLFLLNKKCKNIILMPSNPVYRILKEISIGQLLIKTYKINIIYSYFGIGVFPKKIPQISGSADSNIYFPEINFWENYKGLDLIKKKLIDSYRIWGLKKMNAIIFENKIMQERGKELFNLKNTKYIRPSINLNYDAEKFILPNSIDKNTPIGLFLCGWQSNKNFMIIPKLALLLKTREINFHFIITAERDSSNSYIEFEKLVNILNVNDYISIVGNVKKTQLSSLYSQINFVFLLSKLESFSNNIIEAWFYNKPLIISNELWAKSICSNGAIYVNRNNEEDIVDKIEKYTKKVDKLEIIIQNGKIELEKHPIIDERTKEEIKFIIEIYENN